MKHSQDVDIFGGQNKPSVLHIFAKCVCALPGLKPLHCDMAYSSWWIGGLGQEECLHVKKCSTASWQRLVHWPWLLAFPSVTLRKYQYIGPKKHETRLSSDFLIEKYLFTFLKSWWESIYLWFWADLVYGRIILYLPIRLHWWEYRR